MSALASATGILTPEQPFDAEHAFDNDPANGPFVVRLLAAHEPLEQAS